MKTENFEEVYNTLTYTEGPFHNYHKERIRALLHRIPQGTTSDQVLDIGSSDTMVQLLDHYSNYKSIYALTHPQYSLSYIKPNVHNIRADLDETQIPTDEKFETIICTEMLEHCAKDPMNIFAEANRLLSPTGIFILSVPNICSLASIHAMLAGRHPQLTASYDTNSTNRHNREYTPKEILTLFTGSGFQLIELTTIDCWPYYKNPTVNIPATTLSGRDIIAVAKKTSDIISRYPKWLYHNHK